MRTTKIISILFLVVLIGPVLVLAVKSGGQYKTFKNTIYGFSVEYPSWRRINYD